MINNNRQAGRRRGRGGQQQRPQGGNPGRGQDNGNRIDNRARGNAAQLLEKYKALARDAQMQGDRVNIEYYLQFADHYFRVLAETRSRFEENNQVQQGRRPGGANTFDQDEQDYEDEGEPARPDQQQPRQQNGNAQNGNSQNGNGQNGNGQRNDTRGGQYDEAPRARGNEDERPRRMNGEGGERQPRQDRQEYRQERGTEDRRPQRDGNRQDGRQDGRQDARADVRQDEPRAEQQPAVETEAAPLALETAAIEASPLQAPAVEAAAVEAPAAEAPAAEPRRRGRPRRVVPVESDAAPTFDAGLLPPSLTAAPASAPVANDAVEAAPAAGEGEVEKPRRRRGRPPAAAPVEA